MACGHAYLLKRGKPRRLAPPPRPEPAPVRHQGRKNQRPRQEGNTGRPSARWQRTKGGTCRPWLIDGRGKAWSKRPDRQAGRHGRKRPPLRGAKTGTKRARPTSRPPAQPGACARHAGKVRGDRKTENRFIRKKVGQHRALNGLQRHAEAVRRAFDGQGTAKGRARPESGSTGVW